LTVTGPGVRIPLSPLRESQFSPKAHKHYVYGLFNFPRISNKTNKTQRLGD
jgi:hypothetical protein